MSRGYLVPACGLVLVLTTLGAGGWFVQRARKAAFAKSDNASARTRTLRVVTPPKSAQLEHLADASADAAFQAGLADYQRAKYLEAIPSFYRASAIDPSAPAPHF